MTRTSGVVEERGAVTLTELQENEQEAARVVRQREQELADLKHRRDTFKVTPGAACAREKLQIRTDIGKVTPLLEKAKKEHKEAKRALTRFKQENPSEA